jgi:hypothetical protein
MTINARAGDTITVTGILKYSLKHSDTDGYMFLKAEDGKEFTIQQAPKSAIKIIKTSFAVSDVVQMAAVGRSEAGNVLAVYGETCFVEWPISGYAGAHPANTLRHYVEEPPAQIDIEDYLKSAAAPLSPAQLAEVEAEAEASVLPEPDTVTEERDEANMSDDPGYDANEAQF